MAKNVFGRKEKNKMRVALRDRSKTHLLRRSTKLNLVSAETFLASRYSKK